MEKLKCTECGSIRIRRSESGGHVYWYCADCNELLAHMFPNRELEIF